jgi:hypothetical protein
MNPQPSATSAPDVDVRFAEAYEAWRRALADYLRHARQEISAARLRAAAREVHAVALRKGRTADGLEEARL